MMRQPIISVIGGGAAGFFFAIVCSEFLKDKAIIRLYEKSPYFLSKVKISGGGRCNVTHACSDVKELCGHYPRGFKELLSTFQRFQPVDMHRWFIQKGIKLKTENDGRMFPTTDSSQTIIDCFMSSAKSLGVQFFNRKGVTAVELTHAEASAADQARFTLTFSDETCIPTDYVVLATGGARMPDTHAWVEKLGHTWTPSAPSLFTFNVVDPRIEALQGLSVAIAEASVPALKLKSQGPILITHWGLSGPCILKLSAWGAPAFASCQYTFDLCIDWAPALSSATLLTLYQTLKQERGAEKVPYFYKTFQVPQRLWDRLLQAAGIELTAQWSQISKAHFKALVNQLKNSTFPVRGKSVNREEFVTCGGIALHEINFKTMESKRCSGLYCIGEVLDVDGITGGFNFQACWTGAWIAAQALQAKIEPLYN